MFPDNAAALMKRLDGHPVRVLVVDDEPSLAELMANVLRYEGWEIQTAGDGASAVRAAREFRPDAVVLDVMLPDFDGLEVLAGSAPNCRTCACCSSPRGTRSTTGWPASPRAATTT